DRAAVGAVPPRPRLQAGKPMNDIPTFGFANDTGEPVIFDIGANEWRDAAGRIVPEDTCDGVTRSQTVDPGQVAVDAEDLRQLISAENDWLGAKDRLYAALAA